MSRGGQPPQNIRRARRELIIAWDQGLISLFLSLSLKSLRGCWPIIFRTFSLPPFPPPPHFINWLTLLLIQRQLDHARKGWISRGRCILDDCPLFIYRSSRENPKEIWNGIPARNIAFAFIFTPTSTSFKRKRFVSYSSRDFIVARTKLWSNMDIR